MTPPSWEETRRTTPLPMPRLDDRGLEALATEANEALDALRRRDLSNPSIRIILEAAPYLLAEVGRLRAEQPGA